MAGCLPGLDAPAPALIGLADHLDVGLVAAPAAATRASRGSGTARRSGPGAILASESSLVTAGSDGGGSGNDSRPCSPTVAGSGRWPVAASPAGSHRLDQCAWSWAMGTASLGLQSPGEGHGWHSISKVEWVIP